MRSALHSRGKANMRRPHRPPRIVSKATQRPASKHPNGSRGGAKADTDASAGEGKKAGSKAIQGRTGKADVPHRSALTDNLYLYVLFAR